MSKSLGGFLFIKDASIYDYSFVQAIGSLSMCCEKVVVITFASDAEDHKALWNMYSEYRNIRSYQLDPAMWYDMKGKEKIAKIQNIASMMLDTDYQLLVQADEIVHPDSYPYIRQAIETNWGGFVCERINLWESPNKMLVVPENRQPCSTRVIRLTKTGCPCYGDGESIACPSVTGEFQDKIKIIHYGFVRKREVMKAKIINMQERVFGINHDPKLDQCEVFDPTLWFSGDDLAPINFTHPPIMNQWVMDRL